jgi:hypothetical protein
MAVRERLCNKGTMPRIGLYGRAAQYFPQPPSAARLDGGLPVRGGFSVRKKGDGKLDESEPS